MEGSLAEGGPWVLVAFMTIIGISAWLVSKGAHDDEGFIRLMMQMDLRQLYTINALMKCAIGLMILGVALWSIPQ